VAEASGKQTPTTGAPTSGPTVNFLLGGHRTSYFIGTGLGLYAAAIILFLPLNILLAEQSCSDEDDWTGTIIFLFAPAIWTLCSLVAWSGIRLRRKAIRTRSWAVKPKKKWVHVFTWIGFICAWYLGGLLLFGMSGAFELFAQNCMNAAEKEMLVMDASYLVLIWGVPGASLVLWLLFRKPPVKIPPNNAKFRLARR
jgi:hypothetical protein